MVSGFKVKAEPAILRDRRKVMGYSQAETADLVSVVSGKKIGEATYKKWEAGIRTVDLNIAKAIAGVLGIPVSIGFKSADKRIKFGAEL